MRNILGAFTNLRKITTSFVVALRWLPLDKKKLIFQTFPKAVDNSCLT